MKKIIGFIFIPIISLSACAVVGQIDGGERDIIPPKVVSEYPKNNTTNYQDDHIQIQFDEFISVNNSEIELSPRSESKPRVDVKGKCLNIWLNKKDLLTDITYRINFGNSIRDINEGNILEDYSYAFSTGAVLDSYYVCGKCVDVFECKAIPNAKIILADSSDRRLSYVSRSNNNGEFCLKNLPNKSFFMTGMATKSIENSGELISFLRVPIIPNNDSIEARFFSNMSPTFAIKSYTFDGTILRISCSHPVDSVKAVDLITRSIEGGKRDSLTLYFSKQKSNARVRIYSNGRYLDSLLSINKKKFSSDSVFLANIETSYKAENNFGSPVVINFNQPVVGFNSRKIELYADSIKVPLKVSFIDETRLRVKIDYAFTDDKKYTIKLDSGAFKSCYDMVNSELKGQLVIPKQVDYASLKINLITEKNVIFQLIGEDNHIEFAKCFTGNNIIFLPKILPGKYKIKIINDSNKNGVWDTGSQESQTQPEDVYLVNDQINVKANWELEGIDVRY